MSLIKRQYKRGGVVGGLWINGGGGRKWGKHGTKRRTGDAPSPYMSLAPTEDDGAEHGEKKTGKTPRSDMTMVYEYNSPSFQRPRRRECVPSPAQPAPVCPARRGHPGRPGCRACASENASSCHRPRQRERERPGPKQKLDHCLFREYR